jgi:hypothetical protein
MLVHPDPLARLAAARYAGPICSSGPIQRRRDSKATRSGRSGSTPFSRKVVGWSIDSSQAGLCTSAVYLRFFIPSSCRGSRQVTPNVCQLNARMVRPGRFVGPEVAGATGLEAAIVASRIEIRL